MSVDNEPAATGATGPRGLPATRRQLIGRVLALSAASGLGALSGCTRLRPPTAESGVARIRIELPMDAPTPLRLALSQRVAELSSGHVSADVTWDDPDTLHRRYPPLTAAAQAPDVACVGTLGPAALYFGGTLLDLTETARSVIRQHGEIPWVPTRRAITYDKKLWAVPVYSRGWAWFVREDVFEQLRAKAPDGYADAQAIASSLGSAPRPLAAWALPLTSGIPAELLITEAIAAFGGSIADITGYRVTIDTAPAIAAFEMLAALARGSSGWPGTTPTASFRADTEAQFVAGGIGMIAADAAFATRLGRRGSRPAWADQYLRVRLPLTGPKRRANSAESRYLVASAASRHPDGARQAISALLDANTLRQAMVESEGVVVPAYANYLHDPFWDGDPVRQTCLACVRGDTTRKLDVVDIGDGGPATPHAAAVADQGLLREALRRVVEDQVPPAEAAKQCQQRAERTYQDAGRAFAALLHSQPPKRERLFGVIEW